MLSDEEIGRALHASRVVAMPLENPHGPLGLEELAESVKRIMTRNQPAPNEVQRPIALPVEAWAKLENLARELGQKQSQRISASEVATALVIQGLNARDKP